MSENAENPSLQDDQDGPKPVLKDADRYRSGSKYKVLLVSAVVTLGLFFLKNWISALTGSAALRADSLHSLADFLTTVLVLAAFLAGDFFRHRTRLNPRIAWITEFVFQCVITGLIILWSFTLFKSMNTASGKVTNHAFGIIAAFTSIVICHYLYKYKRNAAERLDSPALRADAMETGMDRTTTIVVLVGIITDMVGLSLDALAAHIILLAVLWHALESLTASGLKMIDGRDRTVRDIGRYLMSRIRPVLSALARTAGDSLQKSGPRIPERALRQILLWGCVTALCAWVVTGVYILKPGHEAVIYRLGRHQPQLGLSSGINFGMPAPIDQIHIVSTGEIRQVATDTREPRPYFITRDENLIDAAVAVQYRITNAPRWVAAGPFQERIITSVMTSVVTSAIGSTDIDDALIGGKEKLLGEMTADIEEILARYDLGVTIMSTQFRINGPPDEANHAFTEVSSAREDARTMVDKAQTKANEITSRARGEVRQLIAAAEAGAFQTVATAEASTSALDTVYKEYVAGGRHATARLRDDAVSRGLALAKVIVLDPDAPLPTLRLAQPQEAAAGTTH